MKRYYAKRMPTWLKVLLGIICIGALFCLVVLVYGNCTGQTFVEVLVDDWFSFLNNSQTQVEEVVQTTSSITNFLPR